MNSLDFACLAKLLGHLDSKMMISLMVIKRKGKERKIKQKEAGNSLLYISGEYHIFHSGCDDIVVVKFACMMPRMTCCNPRAFQK